MPSKHNLGGIGLALAIVELTLTTAYIHGTLGGLLFMLNAAGYVGLAGAYLIVATVPRPLVRRFGWVPRLGLAGYTAATIAAYLVVGPYFTLGWVAKAVEVAILTLVAADLLRIHGSPRGVIRQAIDSLRPRWPARAA